MDKLKNKNEDLKHKIDHVESEKKMMKSTLSEKEKEIERLRLQLRESKELGGTFTDSDIEKNRGLEKKLKFLEKENNDLEKKMQKKVKSTAKFMETFQKQLKPHSAFKKTGSVKKLD